MSLFSYSDVLTKESIVGNLPLAGIDRCVVDGGIYRNQMSKNRLVENLHPELNTYNEIFKNAVKLFGPRPCLGWRPFDYGAGKSAESFTAMTYAEVEAYRMAYGAGILRILQHNRFRRTPEHAKIDTHAADWNKFDAHRSSFVLTIYASNRHEWILTDLACVGYSITNTALYDTLGPESSQYILGLTASPIVVCSGDKLETLLAMKRSGAVPEVIAVVCMDPVTASHVDQFDAAGVELWQLDEVVAQGRAHPVDEMPPSAQSVYTISFTSGTTSHPKGVVLLHQQAVCGNTFLVSACEQVPNGKAFIFLPLTHIYERETSAFALATGYYLGFPKLERTGDALADLVDDLRRFQPHYVSLVPRVLNKMESVLKAHVADLNDFKVHQIIQYKQATQSVVEGYGARDQFDTYEPYVALRRMFGFDNMVWVNTASAPINANTIRYIKSALNIGLRQMYGLTETFGAMTTTAAYDCEPGSSGIIAICGEFRLGAAMEYDGVTKGELLMRGPNIFTRYYKNEEATRAAFDADGWFHTGDVAQVGPKGEITIIDRVKNFFKLSQGEYVSPERLENKYMSSNPELAQFFVHGDSTQSYLVAVVGLAEGSEVPATREQKSALLRALNARVKGLNRFELVKNIHVDVNPLHDVLTPTFKLKRVEATKKFRAFLDRLYEEGPLVETHKL